MKKWEGVDDSDALLGEDDERNGLSIVPYKEDPPLEVKRGIEVAF
jgi:hypothetical protein